MGTIHKLSADVINRIAAGEVVQRPSAALKELLENAIDAGCSRIQVLAADGGLEVLQVSDDGSGIYKEDLPLLCERYATSKLHSFEDLHRITSFGFRGEALASISYMSRVTVTTRRRPTAPTSTASSASTSFSTSLSPSSTSQVAWRAQYLNGSLTSDPHPCAGNPGTTVRAEKLFYNALVRRNSLRPSEEWGRIVDVVSRYALAYPKIGFTCQRDLSYGGVSGAAGVSGGGAGGGGNGGGQVNGGISFPPNSTTRQNIRLSHGGNVVSHLRLVYAYEVGNGDAAVEASADGAHQIKEKEEAEEGRMTRASSSDEVRLFAQMERRAHHVRTVVGPAGEGLFTLIGYTSDPTLAQRKPYLCLFINQRLVESTVIRKAIDSVYNGVLTGGNRPFTVLFLTVPTDRLDVNVHPTKKEVLLLDEELVVARVSEVCRGAVLEAAAARQMDMLKMRHTTALALKQLPMGGSSGGADRDERDVSGSSSQDILGKLRDQHRRGAPMASPLTSSSPAASSPAIPGGGPAMVVAPCTVVRVEPQKGALDRYFSQRLASSSNSSISGGTGDVADAFIREGTSSQITTNAQKLHDTLPTGAAGVSTPAVLAVSVDADAGTGAQNSATAEVRFQKDKAEQRSFSAASTYTAPSWDAVMASLHRTMNPSSGKCLDNSDVNNSKSVATSSAVPQMIGTAVADSEEALVRGVLSPITSATSVSQETSGHAATSDANLLLVVKRERDIGTASVIAKKQNSRLLEDAKSSEDEDQDEDRMREFRRHRRDVYERVEALQNNWLVTETIQKEDTDLPVERRCTPCKKGLSFSEKPGETVACVERYDAPRTEEEQRTMARLGAVVQAADLLRGEETEAARHAPTFAHVVLSSEEGDVVEEGERSHDTVKKDSGLVDVAEVEAPGVLSSVSNVVDRILANTSPSAAALIGQLTYVGAIDADAFLAQVGTTLVWCDTMRLVRHVVFQRIFLRWGQPSLPAPPVLEFDVPLPLSDLLATALAFDAPHLHPPTPALLALIEDCDDKRLGQHACVIQDKQLRQGNLTAETVQRMGGMSVRTWRQLLFQPEGNSSSATDGDSCNDASQIPTPKLPQPKQATHRYIRRLVRRLCRWRGMLKEYFFIDITADGLLLGLPYGLNCHWPPLLRALPLTIWRLAEAVPYPTPQASAGSQDVAYPGMQTSQVQESEGIPTQTSSSGVTPGFTQTLMGAEGDGIAQEVACFTAVARHLADTLYGLHAPPSPVPPNSTPSSNSATASAQFSSGTPGLTNSGLSLSAIADESWYEELVLHGLFPCLKNAQLFRMPDQCLRDGTIQSMVSVESLYKVFERC